MAQNEEILGKLISLGGLGFNLGQWCNLKTFFSDFINTPPNIIESHFRKSGLFYVELDSFWANNFPVDWSENLTKLWGFPERFVDLII